jgi:hypothetical protein
MSQALMPAVSYGCVIDEAGYKRYFYFIFPLFIQNFKYKRETTFNLLSPYMYEWLIYQLAIFVIIYLNYSELLFVFADIKFHG